MPRRPARSLLRLSLPLLLFSCSQAPAPSSRPSKASDPYAAGTSYPWSDRLDAPIGDPYTAGRAFPWTGPSTAAPGLGATQVRGGDNFLSDLTWTSATNAWGPVEKDRSNGEQALGDGRVLTIGTQTFAKGLGVHASSTLSYALGGVCQTFSAQVGVDDEVGDRGSVVFQVYGDGVKLYDSGVTRGADAVKAVSVNVTGRSELKLVVTNGGDSIDYDHADWASAKVSCAPPPAPTGERFLSDLAWTSATNAWGPVEKDRSNGEQALGDGRVLTIGTQTFAKGLGVHAASTLSYYLGGACQTFSAQVGVDDEVGDRGSVVFQVYGDGVKLYDSGVTRGADAVKAVSVNVTGRSDLKLVVTNGGDSIDYDHADWASAKVVCGSATTPPGASARVLLAVPSALRSTPFDVDRFLNVPSGATAEVYARVSKARFLAAAAGDDLLVSQPSSGKVLLVRPGADGVGVVTDFATGLKKPHDMVFHTIGATTYLYVSESNRVTRSVYVAGDSARRPFEVVVRDLPDGNSSGALGGAYGHELKNIALDGDKLYVSIASASNADPADLAQNPKQGAIYLYSATALDQAATSGRLFAQGLRNAEGLALVPGTADLWAVVNNRDNIGYPYQRDFDGDGTNDYGKVMQAYVDNHPPELFTRVRDGGNYGWPFCNSNPDGGLVDMPFDRDVQNNADGSKLDCAAADRVNRGIQAHSAPLSLTFLQSTNAPAVYRQGAVSALHGSWNRSVPTGYKIAFFPWNSATGTPSDQIDLVTGWLVNGSSWGRPVDAIVDRSGRLLVSDDAAGAIYRVTLPR